MSQILVAALLVVLTVIVILGALLAFGAARVDRHYRKAQRVAPGTESAAPLDWVGAHTPEAILHRRLGKATTDLRAATEHDPGAEDNVRVVEQEAVKIEKALVAVSHIPKRLKVEALDELEVAVAQIEDVSSQLIHRSADLGVGDVETQLRDLGERLDALDEARAELDQNERDLGLGDTL